VRLAVVARYSRRSLSSFVFGPLSHGATQAGVFVVDHLSEVTDDVGCVESQTVDDLEVWIGRLCEFSNLFKTNLKWSSSILIEPVFHRLLDVVLPRFWPSNLEESSDVLTGVLKPKRSFIVNLKSTRIVIELLLPGRSTHKYCDKHRAICMFLSASLRESPALRCISGKGKLNL
jgi:hypothetical protein